MGAKITANSPIGIFDSGIGGLTVARAIRKTLPGESFIYFGDTAHLPYGDKSSASIKHYSTRITSLLKDEGCKAVVIACNTASSQAYSALQKEFGKALIIINVIDPIAAYIAAHYDRTKVGVIGTKGTVKSRVYAKRITKLNKNIKVGHLATPLLAPMIEEGFFNNNISQTIINNYLGKRSLKNIHALVLGCTHYPLIKKEVKKYYRQKKLKVEVIDSAEIVAQSLAEHLSEHDLLADKDRPQYKFLVSDYTESFEKSTRIFFKEAIHLDEARIWD